MTANPLLTPLHLFLAIAFLLCALAQFALLIRTFWPYKTIQNQCAKCHYSLQGLPSDKTNCPECGRTLTALDRSTRARWRFLHPVFLWLISGLLLALTGASILQYRYIHGNQSLTYSVDFQTSSGKRSICIIRQWEYHAQTLAAFDHLFWESSNLNHPTLERNTWLTNDKPRNGQIVIEIMPQTRNIRCFGVPGQYGEPPPRIPLTHYELQLLSQYKSVPYMVAFSPELLGVIIEKHWEFNLSPADLKRLDLILAAVLQPGNITPVTFSPITPGYPVRTNPGFSYTYGPPAKGIQIHPFIFGALFICTLPALALITWRIKQKPRLPE